MISFEIVREKPKPHYQHIRDVVRRNIIGVDPVSDALREDERLRRQHALAEGEKFPPRYTNPNNITTAPAAPWVPAAQQKKQPESSWEETAILMGKIPFNTWMNRLVLPKFPKGTMVTLRVYPFVLNNLPPQVWEVIDLQEVYYMANMDRELREPKVVGCWARGTDRIPMYYPPGKLRVLQPEEKKVWDDLIRDKETQAEREQQSGGTTGVGGESGDSAPDDAGENS